MIKERCDAERSAREILSQQLADLESRGFLARLLNRKVQSQGLWCIVYWLQPSNNTAKSKLTYCQLMPKVDILSTDRMS